MGADRWHPVSCNLAAHAQQTHQQASTERVLALEIEVATLERRLVAAQARQAAHLAPL